jgi:hypothetical protein
MGERRAAGAKAIGMTDIEVAKAEIGAGGVKANA